MIAGSFLNFAMPRIALICSNMLRKLYLVLLCTVMIRLNTFLKATLTHWFMHVHVPIYSARIRIHNSSPVLRPASFHVNTSPHCTDLVQGGKGKTGNYYSEIKEDEYEEMKDAEEYEVVDGEGETHANPNAQVDGGNNEGYMDMSGSKTQPQPLQTNQRPSSDEQPHVEVNKGTVVDDPEDQSQTYVNEDEDPVPRSSMTKSPAYDYPPSGPSVTVGDDPEDQSQTYINEDEDPVPRTRITKNPAYDFPPTPTDLHII